MLDRRMVGLVGTLTAHVDILRREFLIARNQSSVAFRPYQFRVIGRAIAVDKETGIAGENGHHVEARGQGFRESRGPDIPRDMIPKRRFVEPETTVAFGNSVERVKG